MTPHEQAEKVLRDWSSCHSGQYPQLVKLIEAAILEATHTKEKRIADLNARVEAMAQCVGCQREAATGGNWHKETLVKGIMAAILDAADNIAQEIYPLHGASHGKEFFQRNEPQQLAQRVNAIFGALTGSHIQRQEPQQ
jgi:hypothetical protein